LRAWCGLGGFGAWLLHGPGGQGKTRLAHELGRLLTAEGWTVLWPHADATADQLAELRDAERPLLVVLDYAETRSGQLAALVRAAADHPGSSPLKLLLLARTDGDWWRQARTESRLAEDYLAAARTRLLAPLEDDPARRSAHYRAALRALAAALPSINQAAPLGRSSERELTDEAYGNALTLHMTALADLLDSAGPDGQRPEEVEDRLLGHERRHWHRNAALRVPALSRATLETALAAAHLTTVADREEADRLWRLLPALADQPRDQRDRVTAWLAALYPPEPTAGRPWGALQPDRLAERHAGHELSANPALADRLLADPGPGWPRTCSPSTAGPPRTPRSATAWTRS
ncbi:ATP-binding protein, partial [Kitasatospora cheerisanensis]|uniref:ATP-binding protein n=1 Tax=Kitasatospora cheerisanensis TaxID=81942 RepID=UPI00056183FC